MEENQLKTSVEKAKQGDQAAFEELYSLSFKQVYFTCISFLGNAEDAKDVMQEVYITAYEKLSSLNDAEKFVPWINRIAVNLCKKILMKKAVVFTEIENAADELTEEKENFLPEEFITQKEKRKLVMDIMRNTLSDIQYKTVILYYFNGLPVDEIADIMECPPGTVKYRLSVARAKIRDGVNAYENKSGDKLYSVVGLPLLMRLLYEETNSIEVPDMLQTIMETVTSHPAAGQLESANATSNVNTSSANHTINTSKGGAIRNMLKTPKTIIAAAAAVIIIGGITAAVIITNRENTSPSDSETNQESQQVSSGIESDQDNSLDYYDADELEFWLNKENWGEEKDLSGITLFNGECTVPIRLEDFDGDENLAPYCSLGSYNLGSYNLTELFRSDILIDDFKIEFITRHGYDEENQKYIYFDDEDSCTIDHICLCNYNDFSGGDVSLRQAYENNWFYITASGRHVLDEFNFDNRIMYSDTSFEIYDTIIEKYGRPSYVIASDPTYLDESKEPFFETLHKNEGDISYLLVWEKEDFTLTIHLSETINVDEKSHNMSLAIGAKDDWVYVPAEFWPEYKRMEYGVAYIFYNYLFYSAFSNPSSV